MSLFISGSALKGLFSFFFLGFVVAIAVIALFQLFGGRTRFASRRRFEGRSSRYLPLLIFFMSYLGVAVGVTGGWSREGVVGDVIPAMLGLIGGLVVYLFENKNFKGLAAIPAAFAFTVSLYLGYVIGAEIRHPVDSMAAYRDMCFKTLSDPGVLSSEEAYCRFLDGPGSDCYRVLFENNMTFRSTASYGSKKYEAVWQTTNDAVQTHQLRECRVRLETLDNKLLNYFK